MIDFRFMIPEIMNKERKKITKLTPFYWGFSIEFKKTFIQQLFHKNFIYFDSELVVEYTEIEITCVCQGREMLKQYTRCAME